MYEQTDSHLARIIGKTILDYRAYPSQGIENQGIENNAINSNSISLPTIPAIDFLRDLTRIDNKLTQCTTRTQLVGRLSQIAESVDTAATFDTYDDNQRATNCAMRDNTYQLIRLLY